MRTILTIVLGVFIAQTLRAQNDSLIIKLSDYGQMLIVSGNLVTEKSKNLELDKNYLEFYNDFAKLDKIALQNGSYILKYKPSFDDENTRELSVNEQERKTDKFYFVNEELASKNSYKYTLEIVGSRKMIIYLDSLTHFEKVSKLSLDSLFSQSLLNIQQQDLNKRKPYVFFYSSKNSQLNKDLDLTIYPRKSQDFIEIYPSFGMQIINSTFSPEININMDFGLGNKGQIGQRFGFSTTFLFIPDRNDFFNISNYNFINASYYMKMRNKWTHKVSIGYLYGRTGDDFGENTWNGYWQTTVNKVGVKLGGFLTKNNEGNYVVIPSIGLNFGF